TPSAVLRCRTAAAARSPAISLKSTDMSSRRPGSVLTPSGPSTARASARNCSSAPAAANSSCRFMNASCLACVVVFDIMRSYDDSGGQAMRIVHDRDVPFKVSDTNHREPNIEFKRLLQGVPGSPQNYEFTLARSPGRFKSPRHRHNFDQIRLCLEGRFGDGKTLDLNPGEVGYYGEGSYYSIDSTDSLVLL